MLELATRQHMKHQVLAIMSGMHLDGSVSRTLHGWWVLLLWQPPAAIVGRLWRGAVRVEHQGVQGCRDGAVLAQAEHVLALMEVLVIQHQKRLYMHPAQPSTGCDSPHVHEASVLILQG